MKKWTAKMKARNITVTNDRLLTFRDAYVSDADLSGRMSELLWFDMYVLDKEFGINPREVLYSIRNLEAGEPHSGIKPASPFKNPPLKGLWHKHYFSAQFLPTNIALALGKNGVEKLVNEVMDPRKYEIITPDMIKELAHRVIHEPVELRDHMGKITGEWVIFAKHQGKNYYLCLNTHQAGDQFIYDRILKYCVRDFPALPGWIKDSASMTGG